MKAIEAETTGIHRVAVIGAGAMGGGIAAQFANAGIAVDLIDTPSGESGNDTAAAGLARQIKIGGFMSPEAAALIRPGNVRDHLSRLAGADWVIEAVIEKLEIKQQLYRAAAPFLKPDVILSSNTSTLPLAVLSRELPPDLARRFAITHFFNPPRVMQLLEIVTAPGADPDFVSRLHQASKLLLGKTTITCRDTPGFVANRIGCFWMAMAALEARRLGLSVETADAIHAALGIPRTGVFGLFDLIGIDLVPTVWGSLLQALPATDALHDFAIPSDPLFRHLIEAGRFGRKTGAGFYRKTGDGRREALDLATYEYRPLQEAAPLPRDPAALLAESGAAGSYARLLLAHVLDYACRHAPEIATDIAALDTAMELGYSWRQGPFALAERAGLQVVAAGIAQKPALLGRGLAEGFFAEGGAALATAGGRARRSSTAPLAEKPVLAANAVATLHDLGDGVSCFRIHSKMNTFDPGVFDLLEDSLARAGGDFQAMIIANDDPRAFSAGADLGFFMRMAEEAEDKAAAKVAAYGRRGQGLFLRMRRAPVPVVAAVQGFALGGGCEFQMHADATIAHAEANLGLPETGVGLVPGWGGCTRLYARAHAADPGAAPVVLAKRAFATIFSARISGSAAEAKALGLLNPSDGIAMHRDMLGPAAKARALALLPLYQPPAPLLLPVAGAAGKAEVLADARADLAAGRISETDFALADIVAEILTGGPVTGGPDTDAQATEEELMALELAALVKLVTWPQARSRMAHMLATGKRLRN